MIHKEQPLEVYFQEKKVRQFQKKKLYTDADLLNFFPKTYQLYAEINKLSEMEEGKPFLISGTASAATVNGKMNLALFKDITGMTIQLRWFKASANWATIKNYGKPISCKLYGTLSVYRTDGKAYPFILNPEMVFSDPENACGIAPVYSAIRGMSTEYLRDAIRTVFTAYSFPEEPARAQLAEKFGLPTLQEMYRQLHCPQSIEQLKKAKKRLAFNTIYDFYRATNQIQEVQNQTVCTTSEMTGRLIQSLPYPLTDSQSKVFSEIKDAFAGAKRLYALIFGDVGCGKTTVELLAACLMAENHYQTVILNPTQILAGQSFEVFQEHLSPLGIRIAYMDSDTKVKEKREILRKLSSGEIDILIGTHAVVSDTLEFQHPGLLVIDEEHRFGVKQKEILRSRYPNINIITMSATPIPRSLANTIYGKSVTVMLLDGMPTGRKPIISRQVARLKDAMIPARKEILSGRQAYIVCPLIEASSSAALQGVLSVAEVDTYIRQYFPGITAKVISGEMKKEEILEITKKFRDGEIQLLISTTIIEVGVNNPNATVMIVVNAERFGLASLHQIRGRVGRGQWQSYCYFVSDKEKERLAVACCTSNGFVLAEEDLRLRGGGKLLGEKQSGHSREIEAILHFPNMAQAIKRNL